MRRTESVPQETTIDWSWLAGQEIIQETELVRHVRVDTPLSIRVDGRDGHGVIRYRRRSP